MLKKVTAILIILIMLLAITLSSFATSISDLEKKKLEAQEDKKEVTAEKSAALKAVEELSTSIEDNEDKLADINLQLTKLNEEIKQLEKDLKEAEEKYKQQEESLKQKMILGYEIGETTYLDVLLNSKGVLDFLSNYYFISEVLQNDNDLLDSIEEQKTKIQKNKEEQESKKKEVKTQKSEQEKINVLLTNQKIQKQNKAAELSTEEKKLASEIEQLNQAIRELEEAARRASQNSSGEFVGGIMKWPCPSSQRITSYFGSRSSPGGIGSTNHKGIDIGASTGAAIIAVLDGKVIQSGYNSARGYYIILDHGGGIVTLYQHGNTGSIRVSVGQNVKQGQTIMGVGSTGHSTGPHLHFEVWKNGTPVNPISYLK